MNESTLVPREEMSDLDWLARNVHVWNYSSDSCYVSSFNGGRRGASSAPHTVIYSEVMKSQWLTRRAELQNKPSWNDAPEWAGWLNQDSLGAWNWQRVMAVSSDAGGYWFGGGRSELAGFGEVLGDWRDTLEKRPRTYNQRAKMSQEDIEEIKSVMPKNWAELESFVSMEDADEDDVAQLGIGVAEAKEFLRSLKGGSGSAATAKQHDPVNRPSHYASGGIECIEAIKASMSREAFLGYLKGNVQKYMWRYEKKVNPVEDLKKARWYLDKLIEEQK